MPSEDRKLDESERRLGAYLQIRSGSWGSSLECEVLALPPWVSVVANSSSEISSVLQQSSQDDEQVQASFRLVEGQIEGVRRSFQATVVVRREALSQCRYYRVHQRHKLVHRLLRGLLCTHAPHGFPLAR
jgi:phosphoglycerate-specific signal transduction histidine kinase